jgi:hypothetical protein
LRIADIDRSCGLTEAQKKKLRLAARGDFTRFFDRVDERRSEFKEASRQGPAQLRAVFLELRPLQTELNAGLLGDGSIFSKAISKTLNEEQLVRYEKALEQKRSFRYRAAVELAVVPLGSSLGLTTDQRRRFVKLLLDETRAPRNYGAREDHVVMLQAAKLPEAKLRPIFDDRQWRVLSERFAEAKQMEQAMRDNGYVPADTEIEAKLESPQGSKDD